MGVYKQILLVGIGGMIGSVGRYLIYLASGNQAFPFATLIINVVGSLVIGVVAGLWANSIISNEWRLFLATGICGGFTTYSAFSLECVQLMQQHKYGLAATYVGCSIVFGIAAAFLGFYITRS
jgi:CrcB protein